MKKSISTRYFLFFTFLFSTIFWVVPGYTTELWQVEEAPGRLRAVINTYSPENPADMEHLRKLVTYWNKFEIPDTEQTPAQWLRFKHGPHETLRAALGNASTPPAALSTYIEAYRASLKVFLDEVVYAEEDDVASTASAATQAAPATTTTAVQTDDIPKAASAQAQSIDEKTEKRADRFMQRLKERLPIETKRVVKQVEAVAKKVEKETGRVVEQVQTAIKEGKVEKETKRVVNQVKKFFS